MTLTVHDAKELGKQVRKNRGVFQPQDLSGTNVLRDHLDSTCNELSSRGTRLAVYLSERIACRNRPDNIQLDPHADEELGYNRYWQLQGTFYMGDISINGFTLSHHL